jgi:hypothetical protein
MLRKSPEKSKQDGFWLQEQIVHRKVEFALGVCRNDFSEPDPDITEENPVLPDPDVLATPTIASLANHEYPSR